MLEFLTGLASDLQDGVLNCYVVKAKHEDHKFEAINFMRACKVTEMELMFQRLPKAKKLFKNSSHLWIPDTK